MLHELATYKHTQLAKVGRPMDLEPPVETLVAQGAPTAAIPAQQEADPDPRRPMPLGM